MCAHVCIFPATNRYVCVRVCVRVCIRGVAACVCITVIDFTLRSMVLLLQEKKKKTQTRSGWRLICSRPLNSVNSASIDDSVQFKESFLFLLNKDFAAIIFSLYRRVVG